jgi:GT2 family glycosyltransferase
MTESSLLAGIRVPNVAAVVLNWNGLDKTSACCRSLAEQTHPALHTWVVDNGSTANTADDLHAACPKATVIRLEENLGFAGGVNAGIRAARASGAFDFVWLVNNDTVCEPQALARMLEIAEGDVRIAAVGSVMLEGGMEGAPVRRVQAGKKLRPPFFIPSETDCAAEIDFICGACLLIRCEALDDVGLLDPGYFFFFEDADWCFRARAKGWRLGVLDENLVYHVGSGTIGSMDRLRASHYRAGSIRFLRSYARFPFAVALPVTIYRLFADVVKRKWASAAGTLEGWRRGWV